MTTTTTTDDELRAVVRRLGLYGPLANWPQVRHCDWLPGLLDYEQTERQRRSLERRVRFACLGTFKPMADFDWQWPKKIDRAAVEELCLLEFLTEIVNVVLIGSSGAGKTMIAKNLAHLALLRGHSARFTTASAMLNDLAAQDSASALLRGVLRMPAGKRASTDAFVEGLLRGLPVLPFDLLAARVHARLWVDSVARGRAIGERDLLIAATAVAHDCSVITRDERSFRWIAELTVERW